MVDCNPERIMVYETHVNEIRLYSSFKCASDYRYPGITQRLYSKENQFEGSIVCFLG